MGTFGKYQGIESRGEFSAVGTVEGCAMLYGQDQWYESGQNTQEVAETAATTA